MARGFFISGNRGLAEYTSSFTRQHYLSLNLSIISTVTVIIMIRTMLQSWDLRIFISGAPVLIFSLRIMPPIIVK